MREILGVQSQKSQDLSLPDTFFTNLTRKIHHQYKKTTKKNEKNTISASKDVHLSNFSGGRFGRARGRFRDDLGRFWDDFGDRISVRISKKGGLREGTFRRDVKEDLAQGAKKSEMRTAAAYIQRTIHDGARLPRFR